MTAHSTSTAITSGQHRRDNTHRIAAVVLLYHPDLQVLENVQSYLPDIETLYLWDNSPGKAGDVIAALKRLSKTEYLTEGRNVGVGRALNIAARRAMEGNCDYLLTMDQDSTATPGMIRTMLSSVTDFDRVGLISPFHRDRRAPSRAPSSGVDRVLVTMTSGNLLSLSVFGHVGGFSEELFIDFVDVDFCFRLNLLGFQVIQINEAILSHGLGNFSARRIVGRVVHPRNHSPVRYFYQARNRLYLRRLYRGLFQAYFRYESKAFWRGIVKMILYEEERLRKIAMIIRGVWAYLQEDFGPLRKQGSFSRTNQAS